MICVCQIIQDLRISDMSKLSLHINAKDRCCLYHSLCHRQVLFKGMCGSIHHDGREAVPDSAYRNFIGSRMVQMHGNRNAGLSCQVLRHIGDMAERNVLIKAGIKLDNDRHSLCFGRCNRAADGLIVNRIDRRHAVMMLGRMLQQFIYLYK